MSSELKMTLQMIVEYKEGKSAVDIARGIELNLENALRQSPPPGVIALGIETVALTVIQTDGAGKVRFE